MARLSPIRPKAQPAATLKSGDQPHELADIANYDPNVNGPVGAVGTCGSLRIYGEVAMPEILKEGGKVLYRCPMRRQ